MKKIAVLSLIACFLFLSCENHESTNASSEKTPFVWGASTIYFLLTDRFCNADTTNDVNFNRTLPTAKLRGFEGGDLKGVIKQLENGYFLKLGINVIWMTPVVEQIHGIVDEGTGGTYGFHGYWTSDWTALDPNFGTPEDLAKLVKLAHKQGIRILLDAVLNHTGPVTNCDSTYPNNWVRTDPQCTYKTFNSTVHCTLVKNLPDVRTESDSTVNLPPALVAKWKAEGRYDNEVKELNEFFTATGYPRAPRFYIMKWLSDYIRKYGIDGYRVDTVKHVEPSVWAEFKKICNRAFMLWKKNHPQDVLDNNNFYTLAEVYGYGIHDGQNYNFSDSTVNYFKNGFNSLINFQFIYDATQDYETLFSSYSTLLNSQLKGYSVANYISSHDDGSPFDGARVKGYEAANKLLLCPGIAQVYYGDESNRSLVVKGTNGDATLRSCMNWNDIKNDSTTIHMLHHWQTLGMFRKHHPSIGAGIHKMISENPYTFSRTYDAGDIHDKVVVALNAQTGVKVLSVGSVFSDNTKLYDAYSNKETVVKEGKVTIDTPFNIVLLSTLKIK